jgi:hypothetical protein
MELLATRASGKALGLIFWRKDQIGWWAGALRLSVCFCAIGLDCAMKEDVACPVVTVSIAERDLFA